MPKTNRKLKTPNKLPSGWQRNPTVFSEVEVKHRRKKNKYRWCKGHEGVEHIPMWVRHSNVALANTGFIIQMCGVCLRHLDYWYPGAPDKVRPPEADLLRD